MSALLIVLLGPHVLVAACLCAGRVAFAEASGNSTAGWPTLSAQRRLRLIGVVALAIGMTAAIRIHVCTSAKVMPADWRGPALLIALGLTTAAYAYGERTTERAHRSGRTTVSIHPLVVSKNVVRVLLAQCGFVTLFVCLLLSSICL